MPRCPSLTCAALLGLTMLAVGSPVAAETKPFEQAVQPLLAKYCVSCHNDQKKEGELDLAKYKKHAEVIKKVDRWEGIIKRVSSKEMPPEDSPQPTDAEREQLAAWVKSLPKPDNCNNLATDETQNFYKGHVMSRRLNRAEYNNSIRDLVGLDLKPADQFPADGAGGEGFDTNGDALFTSAILMEKYLSAADQVLDVLLPAQHPQSFASEVQAARQKLLVATPGDKWAKRTGIIHSPGFEQNNFRVDDFGRGGRRRGLELKKAKRTGIIHS